MFTKRLVLTLIVLILAAWLVVPASAQIATTCPANADCTWTGNGNGGAVNYIAYRAVNEQHVSIELDELSRLNTNAAWNSVYIGLVGLIAWLIVLTIANKIVYCKLVDSESENERLQNAIEIERIRAATEIEVEKLGGDDDEPVQ